MGRRRQDPHSGLGGVSGDLDRFVIGPHAVVDAGKHVDMHVDQGRRA